MNHLARCGTAMKLTASKIYIAFVITNILCKGVGLNNQSIIYKVLMVVGLVGVLLAISSRKYNKKEVLLSAIMILSGAMTLLTTGQYTFLITCITVIGIKRINVSKLIEKICSIRTICFILVFSLALLNIIDRDYIEMWRATGYVSRYGMGYGHPNTLHLTLFIVLTLNYYCNVKKKSDLRKFWIISFFLNLFIYRYSVSRTGLLVICGFEILVVIQCFKFMDKIVTKFPVIVFCTLLAVTFLTPIVMNSGVLGGVSLLNGRVDYTYSYLTRYGYSLFGFNSSLNETGLILDNGYLRLLIETGIIGLLIWGYMNFKLMQRIVRNNDTKMAVIATCFYVYVFMESFSSNIFMNYILFWSADEIFNKGRREIVIKNDNVFAPTYNRKFLL